MIDTISTICTATNNLWAPGRSPKRTSSVSKKNCVPHGPPCHPAEPLSCDVFVAASDDAFAAHNGGPAAPHGMNFDADESYTEKAVLQQVLNRHTPDHRCLEMVFIFQFHQTLSRQCCQRSLLTIYLPLNSENVTDHTSNAPDGQRCPKFCTSSCT